MSDHKSGTKNRGKRLLREKQDRTGCVVATKTNAVLSLKCLGGFDAEMIIDSLPEQLGRVRGVDRFNLNIAGCSDFNNLALSALLVVLRQHAKGLEIIEINGLAPWAVARLARTPRHRLLSSNWQLCLENKSAVFYQETKMQAA